MKRIYRLLFLFSLLNVCFVKAQNTEPVMDLLHRITNSEKLPIKLEVKKEQESTYYQYSVKDGVLNIQASSNAALCRGFYSYIKSNNMGMYSWSGNNINFPALLEDSPLQKVVSPFAHHYYLNVVTYGYSAPYWDWERWEKEIDWMALHGIDMPLALVGYEAILARVWRKMGLTDDEINDYFVGPAHLPWMRMGNISGIDGPLNSDWHANQVALQHRILDRMKSLDMKPICPGFPGFIPEAFKRIYPNLNIIKTSWLGAFHNWMISPEEPLFTKISKEFIKEWEEEFGENDYYLVDSFNEMEIPFPEKGNPKRYEMAAHYGEKVYEGIKEANPKAVWVMQGWMFGYQRDIWDYETLEALVSKVPDNKMMLLDLAVDYNKHFWKSEVSWEYYKGFYNKKWVYSVIPNMGGKVGMTGILDFYANGHLEALSSPNRGNLIAHGLAPEGIENNEVLYELVTDAGWSSEHIDVREWLEKYSINRYGKAPESLLSAWDYLLKSCYGTFTDQPRFNWQLRPGLVKNGSILINDDYFKGLELFIASTQYMDDNPLFKADLAEMTTHYLGGKAEILTGLIEQEYLLGDTLQAQFLQSRFKTLMLGMDALLSQHPTLKLDNWLNYAKRAAHTPEQLQQYVTNARRIVSIWGPPVDDYSARIWSGLIRNYYLKRWTQYYDARNSGKTIDLSDWERKWVEQNQDPELQYKPIDIILYSQQLLNLSKDISSKDLKLNHPNMIGTWNITSNSKKTLNFVIPAKELETMKGFTLELIRGESEVQLLSYKLIADGNVISSSDYELLMKDGSLSYEVSLPKDIQANNGCTLEISIQSTENTAGIIYLLNH